MDRPVNPGHLTGEIIMTKYYPQTIFTQFLPATDDHPAIIRAKCSGNETTIDHDYNLAYEQVNHTQAAHRLVSELCGVGRQYVIHTAAYANGYAHIIEFTGEQNG